MLTPFKQELLANCQRDILEAIARITRYTEGMSEADFAAHLMVQDAVAFNFYIIGEGARLLQNYSLAAPYPALPTNFQYPMRGRQGPALHKHCIPEMWAAIRDYLPTLKSQLTLTNEYASA